MRDTVIRLSLENILVHLLQVVKRTNTPLIAYKKWRRRQDDGFLGRGSSYTAVVPRGVADLYS